jgi:quinol monooxygenase YgiN
MKATISVTPEVTTLATILTLEPENQPKLIDLLKDNVDKVVSTLPGWISTSFMVSSDQRRVIIYSQWRDIGAVREMQSNPQMRAYFPRIAAFAAIDSIPGDIVYTRHS